MTSRITVPIQASASSLPLDKEKKKEVWFDKSLKKNPSQGLNAPFRFDILTKLANIPARITLHELLRLSKEAREVLRDTLADSESFLTEVHVVPMIMGLHVPNVIWCSNMCHPLPSLPRTCFSKIINLIDLCTILGILALHALKGSKVDPGSALSIIPKRLLYFLGILINRLSTTTMIIYGFNAESSHPLGNIIDADTSYNLLLGRTWIHANWIVPSTLHQCFKYIGDDVMVRMVFAEMQLFKGVENYFTDSLLYQESNKPV